MKALVVVSHFNSARTLDRCLSCLDAQDYPCKVVVVDAGSIDGSIEIARKHKVELIIVPGCSEPKGQMIGIESHESEVVCLTNSDCYVPPDWVRRHVMWHERGYGMVGGKLFWGGDEYGFAWSYFTPKMPNSILTSGLSLGFSNCSILRGEYDRLGGFRDMKSQHDMDFWIRFVKGGGRFVLDPKIEVYHDHPMKSAVGSFRRALFYGRNHVILLRAAFGRGPWPGYPAFPYNLNVIAELTAVRGAAIWKQQKVRAAQEGISPSFLRFLWLKFFIFKLPNLMGWVLAMMFPVGEMKDIDIADAHRWGR